jgi:hypothetical protein
MVFFFGIDSIEELSAAAPLIAVMCDPKTVRLVSQLLYNFKSFGFFI